MDESLWPDGGCYDSSLLDQDLFDSFLISEWIESSDVLYCQPINNENARIEDDEVVHSPEDSYSGQNLTNDYADFFVSYDLDADVTVTLQSGSVSSEPVSTTVPCESSSTQIYMASNVSPRKSEKRRFEEYMSEFVGTQPLEKTTKGRNPLSTEGRKKAYQVRKAGACIRCKLMKTPCELELPCASCLKSCKDPTLGRTLCIRQKLIEARFTTDLWDRAHDMRWLEKYVAPLQGQRKTMRICLFNSCDLSYFTAPSTLNNTSWVWDGGYDGPWIESACLDVTVQNFEPLPGKKSKHTLQVALHDGGIDSISPQYNAIPSDCLPSLETLEAWVIDTNRHSRRAFFNSCFHGTFLSLAWRYCECESALPLHDLMRKAVRLSCLHAIWCSALPQSRKSRDHTYQYASKAVHTQIGVIVSEGIVDLEVDILSQLQNLVFRSKGPGKQNMLPIWTCLWLLMLTYRRTIQNLAPKKNKNNGLALAQHMYEMLVSVHSALFRPSSPMGLNWLKEDVFELFGKDHRITHCMGTLKTELGFIYTSEEDFQQSYDTLLRSHVIENEKRLGTKAREAALKVPVGEWAKPNYSPSDIESREWSEMMTWERSLAWETLSPTPRSTQMAVA